MRRETFSSGRKSSSFALVEQVVALLHGLRVRLSPLALVASWLVYNG